MIAVSPSTSDQFLTVTYLARSRCRSLLSYDRSTMMQNSNTITKNAVRKQNLRKYFDCQRKAKPYIGQCQNKYARHAHEGNGGRLGALTPCTSSILPITVSRRLTVSFWVSAISLDFVCCLSIALSCFL